MNLQQANLFASDKRIARSPICCRERHCGSKAEFDPPQDLGGCINTKVRCLVCHATGVISVRKDLA
jgi:hypothetical protein